MAAKVHRLRSNPERLRAEQAAALRDALLPFQVEMPGAVRELVAHIDRQIAARNGWTFIMLSPDQNRAVVRWLKANSSRPMQAMEIWAEMFTALDIDTGEVMRTRDQLAAAIGATPDHVSAIMGELEACGAVIRHRERVAGMRGPGRVHYFMNPLVATHLAGGARDAAQAEAPPGPLLRVMDGGKAGREDAP